MKFNSVLILLALICIFGCSQSQQDSVKKTSFQFNVCDATFNGKPLPFGKPISEWEKLFGKYSRRINWHNYVWDSLGIYLRKSDFTGMWGRPSEEEPDYIRIVFENLESPIGQAGKLEWAEGRKSFDYVIKQEEKAGYINTEEEKKSFKELKSKDSASKYPYPFKVYSDTVIVDGGIISKGMSLSEVNRYRGKAGNKGVFGYWDIDMDSKNERGSTRVKTGEFNDFDMNREKQRCAVENKYYYMTTLRYTEGVLEYIKVQKVEKGKSIYWR
jgi:hypothetical protein